MDLRILKDTPPWEWPEEAGEIIIGILRDDHADESERLLAAELAGDFTVINEELVDALLSIVLRGDETEELRCQAVLSLGPALEYAYTDGFDDPEEVPISEGTFRRLSPTPGVSPPAIPRYRRYKECAAADPRGISARPAGLAPRCCPGRVFS
jgi:hypothetical protein